jgi:hypothetical protein
MMMAANLVGFVIGMDGLAFFVKQVTSTVAGWTFLAVTFPCLFVGVQLMFEYRSVVFSLPHLLVLRLVQGRRDAAGNIPSLLNNTICLVFGAP